jgi:hypothetical protein
VALGRRGRWFESSRPDHFPQELEEVNIGDEGEIQLVHLDEVPAERESCRDILVGDDYVAQDRIGLVVVAEHTFKASQVALMFQACRMSLDSLTQPGSRRFKLTFLYEFEGVLVHDWLLLDCWCLAQSVLSRALSSCGARTLNATGDL